MMFIKLISGFLFFIVAFSSTAETYQVTFTGTWNASDVSSAFPASAHFTELAGATHISGSPLWAPGSLATPGIEKVAEKGNVTVLSSEVDALISSSIAGRYIQLASIDSFPGTSMAVFSVFQDKPEVSLISMIAPSPDWFIGVSGVSLYGQNGWIDTVTVDLVPWDAGTEEGNAFSLSNAASDPHVAIALLADSPFIGSPVIGQLTFERVGYDVNGDGEVNAGDLLLMQKAVISPAN